MADDIAEDILSQTQTGNDVSCVEDDIKEPPRKRFKIASEEEENEFTLSADMLDFVHENFEVYIKEKCLKENILDIHPKPKNMNKVRKLDTFMQDLMKERKKKVELELESTFEKIQYKLNDVMGPLGRLWLSVDRQVNPKPEDEQNDEQLHIEEAATLLEQTVLLVGQCHNMLTYERRKNVLSSVLSGGNTQVAAMLKDQKDLLVKNEDGLLFGKDFKEEVKETVKDRKKSREAFGTSPKKPF